MPGDCIARLAARGHEPLEELTIAYAVKGFGMSRGTMLSAIEMMKPGHAVEYVDGTGGPLRPGSTGRRSTSGAGRARARVALPGGEAITVPRHTDVRTCAPS